jgi:hypothetical protein
VFYNSSSRTIQYHELLDLLLIGHYMEHSLKNASLKGQDLHFARSRTKAIEPKFCPGSTPRRGVTPTTPYHDDLVSYHLMIGVCMIFLAFPDIVIFVFLRDSGQNNIDNVAALKVSHQHGAQWRPATCATHAPSSIILKAESLQVLRCKYGSGFLTVQRMLSKLNIGVLRCL